MIADLIRRLHELAACEHDDHSVAREAVERLLSINGTNIELTNEIQRLRGDVRSLMTQKVMLEDWLAAERQRARLPDYMVRWLTQMREEIVAEGRPGWGNTISDILACYDRAGEQGESQG